MNITTILLAIRDKVRELNSPTARLEVELLPENEEQYQRTGLGAKPRVVVGYWGSEFSKSKDTFGAIQDEEFLLGVEISSPRLYNNPNGSGLLETSAAVRGMLLGFTPPDCSRPMLLRSVSSPARMDGFWKCEIVFTAYTVAVQVEPTSAATLLQTVVYNPPAFTQ